MGLKRSGDCIILNWRFQLGSPGMAFSTTIGFPFSFHFCAMFLQGGSSWMLRSFDLEALFESKSRSLMILCISLEKSPEPEFLR
ncbi:hypothetical protein FGO68_gene16153 [Halteria grandinella]|uniref:Uncharacterized protein n=1 Tax=Halteria grandinella TaxID=5974 RepID=A0A8J8SU22_HALGN|nr:hypothetical protein FGO68_gene16153 [Halteria grandinella]